MVLYDFERDGEIPYGKSLIRFEDGTTKLVSTKSLERSQDEEFKPRSVKRIRSAGVTKHHQGNTRRTAQRKGIPLRKTEFKKQSLH